MAENTELRLENSFQQKTRLLNALHTGGLLNHLNQINDEIADLEVKRQTLVDENSDFLGATNRDCDAAKIIELDIVLRCPEFDADRKKLTAEKRLVWIESEKRKTDTWKKAMVRQREISTAISQLDIRIEAASRRYATLKSYLELRTAQIYFLGN